MLLVGMTPEMMDVLDASGASESIGRDNLYPTRQKWFSALDSARDRAVRLCGEGCDTCPFATARFTAQAAEHESGRFRSLRRGSNDLKRAHEGSSDVKTDATTG
jgi:hypothetical protein